MKDFPRHIFNKRQTHDYVYTIAYILRFLICFGLFYLICSFLSLSRIVNTSAV